MIHMSEAAGRVIAGDTVSNFSAADEALLHSARLTMSVLEGTAKSGLHPRTKQKLLETMSSGHDKLLESRRAFVNAHAQLLVIQKQSNLAPHNWGCWGVEFIQSDNVPMLEKHVPGTRSVDAQ